MTIMSSQGTSKINQLLRSWPRGTLGVQEWLDSMGVYRQLANCYCEGQWLRRIGSGAYQIMDDEVAWSGAVYTLQSQLQYRVHVAALTALELQGYGHFLPLGTRRVVWLIRNGDEPRLLPRWFSRTFGKDNKIFYIKRDSLAQSPELGLHNYSVKNFQIKISTLERAILECIELAPNQMSIEHAKDLMENMSTLRPDLVQKLLEACSSIKTKRLFMQLAEHCGHSWVKRIKLDKINFGHGKRVLAEGGHFYSKYQLSLPIDLDQHEGYQTDEK
jgi:predicted transcriptional regulator of viral defense system